MTAREIIEQFDKLSKDEQNQVIVHLFGAQGIPGCSLISPEVSERFRAIASEVFATNHELFKKLAD